MQCCFTLSFAHFFKDLLLCEEARLPMKTLSTGKGARIDARDTWERVTTILLRRLIFRQRTGEENRNLLFFCNIRC